ncbi:MAG: T9SS type A sorting domain-containing protein [Flavobacteriales bacterium]|nr:T9SS type A sorting domain-containing protein [Flavobacteriales bacterium]
MRKMKILLLAFLFVGLKITAQTALTPATQINQVTSNYSMDGMDSDINDQYYAILYWTNDNSNNITTYLNVYNASTYALIGSPIAIVSDNPEIARVEIDDNNRIYVLYESNNTTSIRSFDVVGGSVNSLATQQVAYHTGFYSTGGETAQDMSITVSGSTNTVLVAVKRCSPNLNQHELIVKKYSDNLSFLGEQMIVQNLAVDDNTGMAIDANQDRYAVVYNQLPSGQSTIFTEFRLYTNSSSTQLNDYSFSSASYSPQLAYNGGSVALTSENLGLKQDGKVVYIERVSNPVSTRLVEIDLSATTPSRSILLNDIKAVDVAVNDNYVVTDGFEKYEMYDGSNTYLHAYIVDEEISNPSGAPSPYTNISWLRELSIHDCQFLVGGKYGNDWNTYPNGTDDYQLYYQLFSPEAPCDSIDIDIPDTVSMCTGFEPVCGPLPYGCEVYTYYWTDPNGNTVATVTECFTPSMYGDHVLTVSVNGTKCERTKEFTVSDESPAVSINDVYYCKDITGYPTLIGFDNLSGSQGIADIIWTYNNGTPFTSGTNQQINYIGDGEYCVQVIWDDECMSQTCFTVEECCEPEIDVNFTSEIDFSADGGPILTVGPGQGAGVSGIQSEEFILYEFCDTDGQLPNCNSTMWSQVSSVSGNPTISGNVQFPYVLNTNCMYKVVYTVTSQCTGQVYENCQIVFYPDECPEGLELEVDCEKGRINVVNLPQGSTVTFTKWSWKKKITGTATQFFAGSGNYSSVSPVMGNGFYEVTMTITLANGMECEVTGIAFYSDDDCCQITHPDGLQASLAANNNVVGYQTVSACGATFNVPIICNKEREYAFDISLCPGIEGYSIFNGEFNPSTCTDISTLYSLAGSGTIPSTLTLTSGEYAVGQINNLTIYATDPGLTPTFQSVNILWIPGNSEQCSNTKNRIVNDEVPTKELEISAIHPNPANDFTTVSWNKLASGTVGIYAMDGRELTSVSFEDQREVQLSTMDLPNGMYIVKLIVDNQTITEKLIKE